MANKTRTFVDIDLSFEPNPNTGDLMVKVDDNAIKNAVKNLILTKHYERAFHSEIGSSITGMLFELPTPGLIAVLNQEVRDVIANFEPRVIVLNVQTIFAPDENSLDVTIIFKIVNTSEPLTINIPLRRVR